METTATPTNRIANTSPALSEQDQKHLQVFIAAGAKAVSQNEELKQSATIQAIAVELLEKVLAITNPPVESNGQTDGPN